MALGFEICTYTWQTTHASYNYYDADLLSQSNLGATSEALGISQSTMITRILTVSNLALRTVASPH